MATRVGSTWIWRGGGCIFHTLLGSPDFPREGRAPVRPLHRRAGGFGRCRGMDLGGPLLDKTRCISVRAALRGAAIGSVALLIFAPLFAIIYVWTEPATEHANILGLAVVLLIGGALAVWSQVALIGAAVGWGLRRLASYHV
jgi:hypothetical protein